MKAIHWNESDQGTTFEYHEIPADLEDVCNEYREKMLEAAKVKSNEVVYDLGSGDGRVLITAAKKFKAKAKVFTAKKMAMEARAKKLDREAAAMVRKAKAIQDRAEALEDRADSLDDEIDELE